MNEIIYVDVLFILNFFVTYLLLLTTKYLLKRETKMWRLLLAAAIGGLYSFIILVPNVPDFLSFAGKFLSAAIMVLVAFPFQNRKAFFRGFLFFFAAGFIYVGTMIACWLTFQPKGLVINNSSIYFNISPKLLIFSSLIAYIISTVIIKLHNRSTAKSQLYTVLVENAGKSVQLKALVDSGNKLKEPFSNSPIIVMDHLLAGGLFQKEKVRAIPYHTIGGSGIMQAYPAEQVTVSYGEQKIVLHHQYIALSKEPFEGDYRGLINPELLNI